MRTIFSLSIAAAEIFKTNTSKERHFSRPLRAAGFFPEVGYKNTSYLDRNHVAAFLATRLATDSHDASAPTVKALKKSFCATLRKIPPVKGNIRNVPDYLPSVNALRDGHSIIKFIAALLKDFDDGAIGNNLSLVTMHEIRIGSDLITLRPMGTMEGMSADYVVNYTTTGIGIERYLDLGQLLAIWGRS